MTKVKLEYSLGKNKKIKTEIKEVKITDLHYYPKNPRISSILIGYKGKLTDKVLDKLMFEKQPQATRTRYHEIKEDGKVNEPLLVYENMTIEGNTRLWVVRTLYNEAKTHKEKWLWVPCRVFKEKLSEDDINQILINSHIKKKKDWEPYEQACYFYRLHQEGNSCEKISNKTNISPIKIMDYIKTFKEMIKLKAKSDKFNYYYETIRQPEVKRIIRNEKLPVFKVLQKKIRTGKIKKAADVRKLTTILKDKKAKKDFFKGDAGIERAEEIALRRLPQERDKLLKDISNLIEDLKQIKWARLESISKNKDELEIIKNLVKEIKKICSTLNIKL